MFDYNKQKGSLLVTPLQPFLLPNFTGKITPRLSWEAAQELMGKLGSVDRVSKTKDLFSAYSGIIGNTRFSLPFEPNKTISGVDIVDEDDFISREQTGSKLRSYIKDKRIARYMVEYARWLYSKFLSENKDSVKSLGKFIRKCIRVDNKYKYSQVVKTFSMNSGLSQDGVIYVKSDETKKRLIYTLQLYALHHPEELKQYKSRVSIYNYYMNVGDFERYRSQVILQGDNAVLKWIHEREQDYSLHDGVVTNDKMNKLREDINRLTTLKKSRHSDDIDSLNDEIEEKNAEYQLLYSAMINSPRFFKNPMVGDNEMYLYQPSVGLSQALTICDNWKRGVNDARNINNSDEDSLPDEDFTLYSYQSPTKLTPYICNQGCREGKNDSLIILGYKNQEYEPVFISLLPLGSCGR